MILAGDATHSEATDGAAKGATPDGKTAATQCIVISHRCRGFAHPENSLRAVRAALASKADAIEIDVRLTKDRKWVVVHNPFVKEERAVLRVHERLASQIKAEATRLDKMLALFAADGNGKTLFIDVKDVGEERQLVRFIAEYGIKDATVVIAWEPEVLRRVHAIDASVRLGLSYVPIHSSLGGIVGSLEKPLSRHGVLMRFNALHSFDASHSVGKTHQHYLASLPALPLHSIQVPDMFCSSKLVTLAHKRGLKVYPFTVNSRINLALLRSRGVDGFLTDCATRFA
jgi:glycerophosphoryl diester phosphodiesterase